MGDHLLPIYQPCEESSTNKKKTEFVDLINNSKDIFDGIPDEKIVEKVNAIIGGIVFFLIILPSCFSMSSKFVIITCVYLLFLALSTPTNIITCKERLTKYETFDYAVTCFLITLFYFCDCVRMITTEKLDVLQYVILFGALSLCLTNLYCMMTLAKKFKNAEKEKSKNTKWIGYGLVFIMAIVVTRLLTFNDEFFQGNAVELQSIKINAYALLSLFFQLISGRLLMAATFFKINVIEIITIINSFGLVYIYDDVQYLKYAYGLIIIFVIRILMHHKMKSTLKLFLSEDSANTMYKFLYAMLYALLFIVYAGCLLKQIELVDSTEKMDRVFIVARFVISIFGYFAVFNMYDDDEIKSNLNVNYLIPKFFKVVLELVIFYCCVIMIVALYHFYYNCINSHNNCNAEHIFNPF